MAEGENIYLSTPLIMTICLQFIIIAEDLHNSVPVDIYLLSVLQISPDKKFLVHVV